MTARSVLRDCVARAAEPMSVVFGQPHRELAGDILVRGLEARDELRREQAVAIAPPLLQHAQTDQVLCQAR